MPELRSPETVCPARSIAVSWFHRPVTTMSDEVVRPGHEMRSGTVCLDFSKYSTSVSPRCPEL